MAGGWEGKETQCPQAAALCTQAAASFPSLSCPTPSSLAPRCFGDGKCGKFTPVLLDFVDFGYSFGRLNSQSQLLESEEYTAQGLMSAATDWHRECGISAVHPHGPCQLPAPQHEQMEQQPFSCPLIPGPWSRAGSRAEQREMLCPLPPSHQ